MVTASLAEPTPEDMQDQMAETRADLTRGAHALGDRLLEMANEASTSVSDSVMGVRDSVHGVLQSVQASAVSVQGAAKEAVAGLGRAFDVRGHVHQRPWLAFAAAFALGVALSRLIRR